MAALVVALTPGEALRVGRAEVELIAVRRGKAVLRIDAPREVPIERIGQGPHRLEVPLPASAAGADQAGLTALPQAA